MLREFHAASAASPGFARALWLPGRAFDAGLARDAVLEATVGWNRCWSQVHVIQIPLCMAVRC